MPEYSIGLDLGGTTLRAAAIDRAGHVLDRRATATNPAAGREAMLGHMVNAIAELRDSCGAAGLAGIGVPALGVSIDSSPRRRRAVAVWATDWARSRA